MAFLLPPIVVQTILRILIDRPVILPPSPEDPRHWLSLVSPQWEAIINSTPDFWSSFTFLPILFRNPTVQLGIFHSLVARSGPNPLCFYFIPDFQAQEILFFGKDNVSIVDDIIHPYIGRIQYLQTILYDAEIRKFLLTIPAGAFSSLEGVDIVSINTLSHPRSVFTLEERSRFRPFMSLPLLELVTWRMFNNIEPLELNFPWSQLLKVDFGTTKMPPTTFLQIVRLASPSLIDAFFYVEFDISSTHLRHQYKSPILLPTLAKFRLRLVNNYFYSEILDLFYLPLLTDLHIERAEWTFPFAWDIPRHTRLLSRTGGRLKKLQLSTYLSNFSIILHGTSSSRCRKSSYTELTELLEEAPALDELRLPLGIHVQTPTLTLIARGELLPKLTTLKFASDMDPRVIFAMIRTRNLVDPSPSQSSGLTPITHLDLTLPLTSPDMKGVFDTEAQSLKLSHGCILREVEPCGSCFRHCSFSAH